MNNGESQTNVTYLREDLRARWPTDSPSKWSWPKMYTFIIPPMDGLHFGMGPGAQLSSVAEIAILGFFSSEFSNAPHELSFVLRSKAPPYKRCLLSCRITSRWNFQKILKTESVRRKKPVFTQLPISQLCHNLWWWVTTQNDGLDPALLLHPLPNGDLQYFCDFCPLIRVKSPKIDFFKMPSGGQLY